MKTETSFVRQYIPSCTITPSFGLSPIGGSESMPLTPPDGRDGWRFRELKLLSPIQTPMQTTLTEFECLVVWERFGEDEF